MDFGENPDINLSFEKKKEQEKKNRQQEQENQQKTQAQSQSSTSTISINIQEHSLSNMSFSTEKKGNVVEKDKKDEILTAKTLNCYVCGKKQTFRCPVCKIFCYCSTLCQESDCNEHKEHCHDITVIKSSIQKMKEMKIDVNRMSFSLPKLENLISEYTEEKCWNMLEQYSKIFKYLYNVVEPWINNQIEIEKKKNTEESKVKLTIDMEESILIGKIQKYITFAVLPIVTRLYKQFTVWFNFKSIELEMRKRKLNIYLFPYKNDKTNLESLDYRTKKEKKYCVFIALCCDQKRMEEIKNENKFTGTDEERLQILDLQTGITFEKMK